MTFISYFIEILLIFNLIVEVNRAGTNDVTMKPKEDFKIIVI
jgi:hypothetical protein